MVLLQCAYVGFLFLILLEVYRTFEIDWTDICTRVALCVTLDPCTSLVSQIQVRFRPPVLPPPLTPLPLRWLLPIHLSTTLTSNTGYVFSSSALGFSTMAEARNNTVSIQHSYIHNSEAGELSFPTVDSTQCKRKAGRVILSPFLLQPAC